MSKKGGEKDYRYLSISAKQALVEKTAREPPVACAQCEARIAVGDMPRHLETTCPGKPREHHLDRWIPWAEVMARGISHSTLHEWVRHGRVQTKGRQREQLYRVRDLDLMQSRLAARGAGKPE